MTGKEQRILSGYHAIGAQKMLPDDEVETSSARTAVHFDMPELRHNIDMLLDRCEEELISADRKLKHNKNNVEVLQVTRYWNILMKHFNFIPRSFLRRFSSKCLEGNALMKHLASNETKNVFV